MEERRKGEGKRKEGVKEQASMGLELEKEGVKEEEECEREEWQ